jgi:uncharacterized protein
MTRSRKEIEAVRKQRCRAEIEFVRRACQEAPQETDALISCDAWKAEFIEIMLEHGANIDAQNIYGLTALHYACLTDSRDASVVEFLLKKGANPNIADGNGDTPLHHVLWPNEECKRIAEILLTHGAYVDFDAAVRLGDVQKVRQFLSRGDVNQSRRSRDLLTNAIYTKSAGIVELLLKHGANPNQTPTYSREPPVYTACMPAWSNTEIVRLLLDYGADPNGKKYKPLVIAKKNNKPNKTEIVELLLRAGASEQQNS